VIWDSIVIFRKIGRRGFCCRQKMTLSGYFLISLKIALKRAVYKRFGKTWRITDKENFR